MTGKPEGLAVQLEKTVKTNSNYWNDYYKNAATVRAIPSQFAAFAACEFLRDSPVIDIGCGNGRDAIFFSSIGYKVIGIDSSSSAVELCRIAAKKFDIDASFKVFDISEDEAAINKLVDSLIPEPQSELNIYSRFFIHAIDEEAENKFFYLINRLKSFVNLKVFLEFRTVRDISLPKETSSHYRRFVQPENIIAKIIQSHMKLTYHIEGFGYAKYKSDDAYVARMIFNSDKHN